MATSWLAEDENLNVNYGSKKSNRLNVESQRFWENPKIIQGDLKCSSSQTVQTTTSCRQTSVRLLCMCVHVCVSFDAGNERRELLLNEFRTF